MGATQSSCESAESFAGITGLYCNFVFFGMGMSFVMLILSLYAMLYFRAKAVWVWLFANCFFYYWGNQVNFIARSFSNVNKAKFPPNILYPLATVFWSISECGDIILFYERFKLLKRTITLNFRLTFFGAFVAAVVTRIIDVSLQFYKGALHDADASLGWLKSRYVEPTYLLFLLLCELRLQWSYSVQLFGMVRKEIDNGEARSSLGWKLLRSSGVRFLFVVVPMVFRIIFEFAEKDGLSSPQATVVLPLSYSVNLFTMFDLIMLKYELAHREATTLAGSSGGGTKPASRVQSYVASDAGWEHGPPAIQLWDAPGGKFKSERERRDEEPAAFRSQPAFSSHKLKQHLAEDRRQSSNHSVNSYDYRSTQHSSMTPLTNESHSDLDAYKLYPGPAGYGSTTTPPSRFSNVHSVTSPTSTSSNYDYPPSRRPSQSHKTYHQQQQQQVPASSRSDVGGERGASASASYGGYHRRSDSDGRYYGREDADRVDSHMDFGVIDVPKKSYPFNAGGMR